jgi:deoxyribonuclease (pyrimidine dimer)
MHLSESATFYSAHLFSTHMVRINLIEPSKLADQHLIAEYNEILMLLGYVRKHPEPKSIPEKFTLGKGHITFFKDKLIYIKKRHETIKQEMRKRSFATEKTIDLGEFDAVLCNEWKPSGHDKKVIIERLIQKFNLKPDYYRYYGEYKPKDFFIGLLT